MIRSSSGQIADHHWLVVGESDLLQKFGDSICMWIFLVSLLDMLNISIHNICIPSDIWRQKLCPN